MATPETAPKSEEPPCYYELLGVEKTSTQDQIRKAYLRASLKFHPDKNPGDEAAEEMFKLISEAYNILSDPEKRELYDKYGHAAVKDNIDPEELFERMFGTRDPKEAFKKVMADPELRGPVVSGIGLATTVGSVYAIYNGIKNKKGASAVGHTVGGLVGTVGGLTVTVGGLAWWGVDAAITASKKGIKNISDKIDEAKEKNKKTAAVIDGQKKSPTEEQKSESKKPDFKDFFNFSNYMSPTSETAPTAASNSSKKEEPIPMPMPMPAPRTSSMGNSAPMGKEQQNFGHPFGSAENTKQGSKGDGYENIYPQL